MDSPDLSLSLSDQSHLSYRSDAQSLSFGTSQGSSMKGSAKSNRDKSSSGLPPPPPTNRMIANSNCVGSRKPPRSSKTNPTTDPTATTSHLRALTLSAIISDQPRQAQFFADKLVAVAGGGYFNTLLLAKSHVMCGELRRAVLSLETAVPAGTTHAAPNAGATMRQPKVKLIRTKTPLQPHCHVGGHIYAAAAYSNSDGDGKANVTATRTEVGVGNALLGNREQSGSGDGAEAASFGAEFGNEPPLPASNMGSASHLGSASHMGNLGASFGASFGSAGCSTSTSFDFNPPPNTSNTEVWPSTLMCIEAALISSNCLLKAGAVEEAGQLLESVFTFTYLTDPNPANRPHSNLTPPPGTPLYNDAHPPHTTLTVADGDHATLLTIAQSLVPPATNTDNDGSLAPPNTDYSNTVNPLARLACLRAIAYAELDNTPRAIRWFKSALLIDARCVEAFEHLVERHMMTKREELAFVREIDFRENEWLKDLYLTKLTADFELDDEEEQIQEHEDTKSLAKAAAFQRIQTVHQMGTSPEVLSALATTHYNAGSVATAASLCALTHRQDALCEGAACVHICCLVDLRRASELFYYAHQLVDSRPRSALSWFAVGSYYLLIGKSDVAQRHFSKASRLNPRFVEAWVAYGHSFAAQDESDQAMSAYRAAQRLYAGSHVPLLFLGMEHIKTNNRSLAKHFLLSAQLAAHDPLSYNELGVVEFRQGNWEEAAMGFWNALRLCRKVENGLKCEDEVDTTLDEESLAGLVSLITDPYWEPTLNNLGHAFRKLRRYAEACVCLEAALTLSSNASTKAALAYSRHLQGDLDAAIQGYHEALAVKPDDALSSELLNKALLDAFSQPGFLDIGESLADDGGEGGGGGSESSLNLSTSMSNKSNSHMFSPTSARDDSDLLDESDSFMDASNGSDVSMG